MDPGRKDDLNVDHPDNDNKTKQIFPDLKRTQLESEKEIHVANAECQKSKSS